MSFRWDWRAARVVSSSFISSSSDSLVGVMMVDELRCLTRSPEIVEKIVVLICLIHLKSASGSDQVGFRKVKPDELKVESENILHIASKRYLHNTSRIAHGGSRSPGCRPLWRPHNPGPPRSAASALH